MRLAALLLVVLLPGCGAISTREAPAPGPQPQPRVEAPAPPAATAPEARRPGAYYKDDGPGDRPPADMASIPDATPRAEPAHRFANRPYQAFGRSYTPLASAAGFRQQGRASWYGKRYHGQKTSSGEVYDMYAMTAAHPVLPIPSYVRVTNIANGKSVVVRVNDRGPFHAERVIDLSYTAAWKLGFVDAGGGMVRVESIDAGGVVAAAPAAKPVVVPAAAPVPGVYLQLGAFTAKESADSFRDKVSTDLAWLGNGIHVFAAGGFYRLQLGPYRTHDDARPVAERIESELALRPLLVVR
jgi:rare lipoprotein A